MKNELITIEEYNKLPKDIIRHGLISNSSTGVFMSRDENIPLLRFVVVKRIEGWTVYLGRMSQTVTEIYFHGDKSSTEEYIRRCFPCTDEVFKLYIS